MSYPIDIHNYWMIRKDLDLYKLTKSLAVTYFPNAKSAIDVGSYVGGLICDLVWIKKRVATDIQDLQSNWNSVEDVKFMHGDAFKLSFPAKFDLVISNQTIEHLQDPKGFIDKLLSIGRGLIVTTTYNTPHGLIDGHIQDPINLEKFLSWFPCAVDAIAICSHPTNTQISFIIGVVNQSHPGSA
jgi:2-polyprenyl-3-methyl-5-hydroxy-6-metoxy-1,4-benzoquinol methylase